MVLFLVPLPSNPTATQRKAIEKKAKALAKKAKSGVNFSQLAAAESGGSNALKGGDLSWRRLVEIPTIFADPVSKMHKGEVAGPIAAPNGFHIIKLSGVRANKTKLTKDQVGNMIYQRKFEEKVQVWLKNLREEAYVKVM